MSKLYNKPLIYIPTDLIGNSVIDEIRKGLNLQTKNISGNNLQETLYGGNSKIIFKVLEKWTDKKVYLFEIKNYNDMDKIKDLYTNLSDGLKEAAKKDKSLATTLFFVLLVGAGIAAAKLVGTPIFDKDLFFDLSLAGGRVMDKSLLLPSDATEAEKNTAKVGTDGMYYFYKIRSYFDKYVSNDPFKRFDGNLSTDSDLVPSLYKMVESNYYQGNGLNVKPTNELKGLNYSLYESEKLNHAAFFDLETYALFLQGCQNLSDNKLKSAASFKRKTALQYNKQRSKIEEIVHLPDLLPFHTKTEFVPEKNSFNGFSFASFLNSPQIQPFFKRLIGMYVDITENPNKYIGKNWFDNSEEFTIFDSDNGNNEGTFNTKVIRANELVKDPTFLNFELSKNSDSIACSNIQKKISSLLFAKKIKEHIVGTLADTRDFWINANYSETVCYRITKTDKFTGKISHWFVPNFPSLNMVEIFDTNLRFDRGMDFLYEVFALKATVAIDYQYKVLPSKAEAAKAIDDPIKYITEKIISTPYGGTKTNPDPDLFFAVEARPSVNFIEVPFSLRMMWLFMIRRRQAPTFRCIPIEDSMIKLQPYLADI